MSIWDSILAVVGSAVVTFLILALCLWVGGFFG